MAVYLLHFHRKIAHAGHYLGYAKDVKERIERHRTGGGARLMTVLKELGIGFDVARIWPDGDRKFERSLKKQKNSGRRLCPICRGEPTDNEGGPDTIPESL